MRHWKEDQLEAVASRLRLQPRTPNQAAYLEAMGRAVVTACDGPAGTGKTLLACGFAVQCLREERVDRVVISRPMVPCGQGVGYLPGNLDEKVGPYMRPLLDAFGEFASPAEVERWSREKKMEMLPLDLMRGTSLRRSFLVCDECQNATYQQLHMFLTRFGDGSKVVLAGDATPTQTDLVVPGENPFSRVLARLAGLAHKDVALVRLTRADVQRHPLVAHIDRALAGEEAWFDLRCPACSLRIWYPEPEAAAEVERVRCYSCRALVDLFDGDDFRPAVSRSKAPAAATYPARP